MTPAERKQTIEQTLTQALQPSFLNVIDESHLHIGHAGAAGGVSHFAVEISADALAQQKLIKAHQMIYDLVGHLIPDEVHALRIMIK